MKELVEITKISPRIRLDIRYATVNNFTGKKVYTSERCFLRSKTAERLHLVQLALEKQGLGLKIYDAYRPLSIQKVFWKLKPDPCYVADPSVGSKHNRGASVDLTLVDQFGKELSMPTEFDEFSEKASRKYMGCSKEARKNRKLLEQAMKAQGFIPFEHEWWHFDDPEWESYPVLDHAISL